MSYSKAYFQLKNVTVGIGGIICYLDIPPNGPKNIKKSETHPSVFGDGFLSRGREGVDGGDDGGGHGRGRRGAGGGVGRRHGCRLLRGAHNKGEVNALATPDPAKSLFIYHARTLLMHLFVLLARQQRTAECICYVFCLPVGRAVGVGRGTPTPSNARLEFYRRADKKLPRS